MYRAPTGRGGCTIFRRDLFPELGLDIQLIGLQLRFFGHSRRQYLPGSRQGTKCVPRRMPSE
jgi:hypothetical protein